MGKFIPETNVCVKITSYTCVSTNKYLLNMTMDFTCQFINSSCENARKVKNKYWFFTKLVRSRWLDIGQVFFCVRLLTKMESRSINMRYPVILTKLAWSIKDLLYGFQGNFSCGCQVVPSGQDSSILPAQVANHSAEFYSSCPHREQAT